MTSVPFLKMHGAGNDFVVIDNRKGTLAPAKLDMQKISDRHFGIGCDQVVVVEASKKADVRMRIFNADGGEVESCGNASRCVAVFVGKKDKVSIETLAGVIEAQLKEGGVVTMDMGAPRLDWKDIPLASACDTLSLPIKEGRLHAPAAVSMGNPHMVFFVSDVEAISLSGLGPVLEHHPLFPERANVNVAQVDSKNKITLRVWERGAGITLACGTGACATLVAANRRGLTDRKAQVHLPGGVLLIEWRVSDDHVLMTGPVAESYEGSFKIADFTKR